MLAAASSGFRPEDRLRQRREFLRTYQEGRRVGGRCFSLFYHRGSTDYHRLGLTVPRQVGGAVVRNRVKRRLREIFRLNRSALGSTPLDLVLNVYPPGARASSQELRAEFLRAVGEALQGRGRPGGKLRRPRRRTAPEKVGVATRSTDGSRR